MGLRDWWRRRREGAEVRRLLSRAFDDPAVLATSSLKARHRERAVVVGWDREHGRTVRIRFGVVRHPRPYAFSRQSHEVVVYYEYDLDAGTIHALRGVNLTRRSGKDASR